MSLQSALIGFLVSRLLPTPLSPQEIIVVQTTAVATGTVSFDMYEVRWLKTQRTTRCR